jgi:hypothetical protein
MTLIRSRSQVAETIDRVAGLPGTGAAFVLLLAYFVTAVVCAFLPLADHIGFELAGGLTIVAALFTPWVGVAAVRLERLRSRSDRSQGLAAAAAASWSVFLLVVPVGIIFLNGLRRPSCDPSSGAVWLLLLPVPSAMLGAATGAVARSLTSSRVALFLLVIGVEIGTLLFGLSRLYTGPGFFLFDHFFGYFPGPLYDEVVTVTPALLYFRAETVLWALTGMCLCATLGAEWPGERNRAAVSTFFLAAGLTIFTVIEGSHLGYRSTDAAVAEALGGVRTIDDLEIHYPREWSDRTIESFAHDAAFRASQVIQALGLQHPPTVKVWVYRSAEEKRRLVGASGTSFSKPWRHEVHINASATPHPVLRHELVHAFAAEIAHGPFGTPGGLIPNSPLTEGFAVALDVDSEGLTLAQWAKAMRELHIAPDVNALLSTAGFFQAAPYRAYQYAGAFLRFIDEKYGRARLLDLYATGDLHRIGKPEAVIAEFNLALDAVTVTPAERATAERALARPSVFHRRCAREVSHLSDEAQTLLSEGRTEDALATYDRVCAMEPDDPALLESLLRAAVRAKNNELRDKTASRIMSHPKTDNVLKATTLMELGDDDWRRGTPQEAAARYASIGELAVDPGTYRLALVKRTAVNDTALSALLEPLLVENDTEVQQLFAMNDYIEAHPTDRLVRYLLGRQLMQREALPRGLPLVDLASENLLLDGEMTAEALRLLVKGYSELHRCQAAQLEQGKMASSKATEADRVVAQDWIDRCQFEVARGWKPWSDRTED